MASFILNYEQTDWNVNLAATYSGARNISSENTGPRTSLNGYWQVFSKLSYRFNHKLKLYAQVKNALDEVYFTPPSNPSVTAGVPNREREWLMGITWVF